MNAAAPHQPLTNLQVELLKLFARQVPEKDLLAIKNLLARYFAEQAMSLADEAWDAKGYSETDEDGLLEGHFRTPYRRQHQ